MDFSEIRKISIDSIESSNKGCGVLSNLNWARFERQVGEISKLIPENSKVLDIGCGRGMTAVMIKKIIPSADIVGIDLEKFSSWDNYTKKYGVEYRVGDATKLEFKNKEFDAVVSFGVIEHVTSDQKFIKENLRVLKKNGHGFILNIPNKFSMNEFLARRLGIWSHEVKYSRRNLENLLVSNSIKEFNIERRFLIPAQVCRVNSSLGNYFDKFYSQLDFLDRALCKSPLNVFSQVFDIFYKKP